MCIHVNHWTIYQTRSAIVLCPRREEVERCEYTKETVTKKNRKFNWIVCGIIPDIQYWLLILILSLSIVFFSPFGWFLIWLRFFLSFVRLILFVHSFVYALIRHMCTMIVYFHFASITYILFFFSLSFSISVSLSNFRHANSHREFFHIISYSYDFISEKMNIYQTNNWK